MNYVCMLILDGGSLSDHAVDWALLALIPFIGWLLNRAISAVDDRQKAADAESKKQGSEIVKHTVQIARHDIRIKVLEKDKRDEED